MFDQQYKVLDAGWVRVPTSAHYTQQKLSFARYIKEAGYYFTYLSYEDQSNNMVYFDDYQVRHVKSRLIQGNEYYPHVGREFSPDRFGGVQVMRSGTCSP